MCEFVAKLQMVMRTSVKIDISLIDIQ